MSLIDLARSLGIVETIKFNSGTLTNSKQNFKYLIVVDFESTCWKDKEEAKWRQPEIIGKSGCQFWLFRDHDESDSVSEFPAVLIDLSTNKILSEFHQFILPIESPKLSEFCINFTGINQETIDNDSVPLQTGLMNFQQWLNESVAKYNLILPQNADIANATTAFVTWSDWDFGVCLLKECERKRIKKPQCFDQWIDLKATFKVDIQWND